jgi:hypothetical protein
MQDDRRYNEILNCVKERGVKECTHLATLWLDANLSLAKTSTTMATMEAMVSSVEEHVEQK